LIALMASKKISLSSVSSSTNKIFICTTIYIICE
jgi:hypothetical protein